MATPGPVATTFLVGPDLLVDVLEGGLCTALSTHLLLSVLLLSLFPLLLLLLLVLPLLVLLSSVVLLVIGIDK